MKLEVVIADAGQVHRRHVELPVGARVADVLAAAGVRLPANGAVGVWGRLRNLDDAVADGERVEVYAPLTADPKQARRSRARRVR